MKLVDKTIVAPMRAKWADVQARDIASLFFKENQEVKSDCNCTNEFARLAAIDLGTASTEFREAVGKCLSDDLSSLSMQLAVDEENGFMVFFSFQTKKSVDDLNPTTQEFISSASDMGKVYVSNKSKEMPNRRKFGISAELKDQLCINWWFTPYTTMGSFFSSVGPKKPGEHIFTKRGKIDPYSLTYYRALMYPVVGKNLEALGKILRDNSQVIIHFGINPSDAFYNEDLFTLIIEVNNPVGANKELALPHEDYNDEDDDSNFLDFVQACPPLCCRPGEPDDPCKQN